MRSKSKRAGEAVNRADVERLLDGPGAAAEHLGELPSIVAAISRMGDGAPTEEQVRLFATEAAKQVPPAPAKPAATQANAAGSTLARSRARRRRLVVRLAGVAGAVVVALAGFGGFAYAANGAVPGDTLYGTDLALEKAGIGDGGVRERLNEASQLVERGRFQEGLALASDAVAESADGDEGLRAAAEALRVAAQSALRYQNPQTSEELGNTAKQLREMASGDNTSAELGQAVEDLAGSLGSQGSTGGGTGGGTQDQGGTTDTTDTTGGTGGGGGAEPGGSTGSGGSGSGQPSGPAGSGGSANGGGQAE